MFWVGLTGGIATGKSTVAEFLIGRGYPVIYADHLAHLAMAAGSLGAKQVQKAFGSTVFHKDGTVDRGQLGKIIFLDKTGMKKKQLEEILHPAVRILAQSERARLKNEGHEIAFYEIPLLFEKNLKSLFDTVICVAASNEIQVERLMARSQLSHEEAKVRIAAQMPQDLKVKQSDFVIWNQGQRDALEHDILSVLERLEALAKSKKS